MSERKKPIAREAFRQEKAVVFVRDAVTCPHTFLAFDRSQARGARSHLFEAKRGIRASTPDTLLIARISEGSTRHIWAEWKAPGQRPNDGQLDALARLRTVGDHATWCVTIDEYRLFLEHAGVPLVANAAYRAMVLDGLVDSRIAKAEGAVPATTKKRSSRRAAPAGKATTVAQYRRMHSRGLV